MHTPSLVLFGSFLHFSTLVAEALNRSSRVKLVAVVSTPPQPAGRNRRLQPTHTHAWAQDRQIPVFTPDKLTPETLTDFKNFLSGSSPIAPPDFILSAGYSKLIPRSWLDWPNIAPLNFHPSLLPKYPGTRPGEFALLHGETQTGITLHHMDEHFDTGPLLIQKTLPVAPDDTRLSLYQKLYQAEADTILEAIEDFSRLSPQPQTQPLKPPYARTLTRQDGYLPWETLHPLLQGENPPTPMPLLTQYHLPTTPPTVERAHRALYHYPGLWTQIATAKGPQRLKLLELGLTQKKLALNLVQLEGRQPSAFSQIQNQLV